MTTYADNRRKLVNSRVAGPTQYPVRVGANGMAPPYGTPAGTYLAQELLQQGFNTSRSAFTWTSEAPTSSTYDWTKPDNVMPIQSPLGIRPVMQHIFTPSWAYVVSPGSDRRYSDVPLFSDTTNFNAWVANHVAFAIAAATKYGDTFDVEVWNEMNTPGIYWRGDGSTSATPDWIAYGHLYAALKAAYQSVHPGIKVCVGGLLYVDSHLVSGTNATAYIALLKPVLDGLSVTPDAVAIHPYILGYTNGDPTLDLYPQAGQNSFPCVRRFQRQMVSIGWGNVPTWITEFGYIASSANSEGAYNAGSEAQKAVWYRQEFDYLWYNCTTQVLGPGQAGVELICVYKLENYSNGSVDTDSTGFWTGTPVGGPHTQLPAGVTIQDFMHRIRNGLHVPLLTGMAISGPTTGIVTHGPLAYSATGTDDGGLAMGCTPIFHTSDPTVATITSAFGATSGTLTIVGPGTCSVWGQTYNAKRVPIQSSPIVLVVAAQIPTVGTITPNPFAVAVANSGTVTFAATYTDQLGSPIIGQPTGAWSSSDPTNAPIDSVTGILTAVGVSASVTVTFTPTIGNTCTATGQVTLNPILQITNAPSTLLNVGALALTVTDGVTPVPGIAFVISDPTKATSSTTGSTQWLVGLGTSGTFTLTAQKGGYHDSAPVTITCTTGGAIDDKDAIGLPNGSNVTSYTDTDGIVWSQATHPPTYATNDYQGHASLVFDGIAQYLRSGSLVARLNGSGMTYAAIVFPTSNAPASNEQMLDNRDSAHSQGFVLGRNATTMNPFLDYYTAPGTLTQRFDGTALPQSVQYRLIDRVTAGNQTRWVNGIANGTQATDATYQNPVANPPTVTKGSGGAGGVSGFNFAAMHLGLEILVNRYVSDAEAAQIDQRMQFYLAQPYLNSIVISGPTANIVTHTASYTASGFDQYGNAVSITPVWSSASPSVATINSASGVATGVSVGTSAITCSAKNVTSTAITVTVSAQVATSPIAVSPSSFTVAPTATQALTAVVSDQGSPSNVISGASVSWSSGTPANITVNTSTGVATGVTSGTSTITATSGSATGTSAGTCSGAAVTSVHLFYNSAEMTNGMLLFTGNTYSLTAKDQSGNVLSGGSGTWASSDGTNFPVSAGVISPAAGAGGGTVTFTHAASGKVGTVNLTVFTTPGAIYKQGGISSLANTTALMAQISSSLGVDSAYNSGLPTPTGSGGGVLYSDGLGVNHFSIDTTTAGRQFMGNGVMVQAIPTTTPVQDGAVLVGASGFTRAWGLQLFRFDPGFVTTGSGGGGASFKIGNWFAFSGGGRVGLELDGSPLPQIVNDCIKLNGGSTVGGAQGILGNITTEFSGGGVWCSLVLYEVRGGNIMSSRVWWFPIGSAPSLLGSVTEGPMTGGASPSFAPPAPVEYQPTGVNFNQAPPASQLNVAFPMWMLINGDTQGDPFGVLADTSTPTLTGISGGTVARGATAASVVLTGTHFTANCQPTFSSPYILPQSITINSSTQMTVVVACNSGATPGAFTVLINNQSSQANSATQPITIT